jgi:hypothetical protein
MYAVTLCTLTTPIRLFHESVVDLPLMTAPFVRKREHIRLKIARKVKMYINKGNETTPCSSRKPSDPTTIA